MSTIVKMPKLSDTMVSGKLISWKKKIKDVVSVGDIIAEVETDKAVMELESFENGIISKFYVEEGEVADVGSKLYLLNLNKNVGEVPKTVILNKKNPLVGKKTKEFSKTKEFLKTKSSPYLKFLMFQKGDLRKSNTLPVNNTYVSFSAIERYISAKMVLTKKEVPHFYIEVSVDVTKTLLLKKELKVYGLTVNDFILKATSLALKECPDINSSWIDKNKYCLHKKVDLGFAVNTPRGVVVPVLNNCDKKNILEISLGSKKLVKQAREGFICSKSIPSFTVTNLGMYGVSNFFGIINSPNSGILSVGGAYKSLTLIEPYKKDTLDLKDVGIVDKLNLSFSGDHRILDGVKASIFLNKIKFYLEEPIKMLIGV